MTDFQCKTTVPINDHHREFINDHHLNLECRINILLISVLGRVRYVIYYSDTSDVCHGKTDLKVFVVVIPKEGWARMSAPTLMRISITIGDR